MHHADFGYERHPYIERFLHRLVLWVLLALMALALLSSCAGGSKLPPRAGPAVKVLVPVTQPCEVEQVETSELHTDDGAPPDIYGAVQQLLADLQLLKADREELKAANTDPCPETQP